MKTKVLREYKTYFEEAQLWGNSYVTLLEKHNKAKTETEYVIIYPRGEEVFTYDFFMKRPPEEVIKKLEKIIKKVEDGYSIELFPCANLLVIKSLEPPKEWFK